MNYEMKMLPLRMPLQSICQLKHIESGYVAVKHTENSVTFTFQLSDPNGEEILQNIILKDNPNENSLILQITTPYEYGAGSLEEMPFEC